MKKRIWYEKNYKIRICLYYMINNEKMIENKMIEWRDEKIKYMEDDGRMVKNRKIE